MKGAQQDIRNRDKERGELQAQIEHLELENRELRRESDRAMRSLDDQGRRSEELMRQLRESQSLLESELNKKREEIEDVKGRLELLATIRKAEIAEIDVVCDRMGAQSQ